MDENTRAIVASNLTNTYFSKPVPDNVQHIGSAGTQEQNIKSVIAIFNKFVKELDNYPNGNKS